MTLLLDVDGVLANFTEMSLRLLKKLTGRGPSPAVDPFSFDWVTAWNYHALVGYSGAEWGAMWRYIEAHPDEWRYVYAMPETEAIADAVRALLHRGSTVYFVTSRPDNAQTPTAEWLKRHGFTHPNVIVSAPKKRKMIARSLGAHALIDDNAGNIADMERDNPATPCYLVRRPWNRGPHKKLQEIDPRDIAPTILNLGGIKCG